MRWIATFAVTWVGVVALACTSTSASGGEEGGVTSDPSGTAGTSSSTDTSTSSSTETTDPSSTETETETETETGEEPELPELPEPEVAELPCQSFGADPGAVIGAFVPRPNGPGDGALHFVRADGSSFVAYDGLDNDLNVRGDAEGVAIFEASGCSASSTLRFVERDTGALVWGPLQLPRGFGDARVGDQGRIVVEGSDCDDPEPYFIVLEDGAILDEGYGRPVNLRVRPDDWLPLYRPYYEDDPPAELKWRWRNVLTQEERAPLYSLAPGPQGALYLPSGALAYFTELEGSRVLVVEDPTGEVVLIDDPVFDEVLAAEGTIRLEWARNAKIDPYDWNHEYTLIELVTEAEGRRWFELTVDRELVELELDLPPNSVALDCATPDVDEFSRLHQPVLDDGLAWLYVDQGGWQQLGAPLHGVGNTGTLAIGETFYIRASGTVVSCEDRWGPAPEQGVLFEGVQYIRGEQLFVPNPNLRHVAEASGRCIAHAVDDVLEGWHLHDMASNGGFALPLEWGRGLFTWLR